MPSRPLTLLFAALPAFGHVYPMMPLAEACRAAGHRVLIATDAAFGQRVAAAGFETAEVSCSIDGGAQELIRGGFNLRALGPHEVWRFGAALFGDVLARPVADELAVLIDQHRPDLVVYDEMNLGAALAAGLAGVPAVRHGLGPWPPVPMQSAFADLLAGHWDRAGRTPPAASEIFGRLQLDVWPAALRECQDALPGPSTPLQPSTWDAVNTEVPSLLRLRDQRRPLVYLTLGTVFFGAVDVLRAALQALAELDVDVLASVGPGGSAVLAADGGVPANATVADFVAQGAVLRSAQVVVNHGGAGTTLGALAEGLPQLVIPQRAHDQFTNARVIASSGAGLALMPPQVSVAAIRQRVESLLTGETFVRTAQARRAELQTMPTAAEVVVLIEQIVSAPAVPSPVFSAAATPSTAEVGSS